jgi:hypothetical protein
MRIARDQAVSFGTATTSNLTAVSIDTADLDGDADLDVAAAMGVDEDGHTPANTLENGHVTIFVNDGQGGLVASPTTLPVNAPADLLLLRLAGDADPDLIVAQRNRDAASTVKIFAGAADASFKAAAYAPAGAQATELDAGNFDDDGRVDVVVAHGNVGPNAPQPGSILPGAAAAALGPPITVAAADGDHIVAGDLDRDGRDDLYVAYGRPAFPFLDALDDPIFVRGLGDLRFAPRDRGRYDALPRFETSPQLADIDADGKLDVVTSGWNGNVPPDHVFIRFGLGPQLVPSSATVDFGSAALGTRASVQTISFENTGPGTAASLERKDDGDIGDFPVTRDTCTGATLAIGATCTLEVAFAPTALGERIADAATFAPDSEYIYPAGLIGTGVPVSAPPSPAGIPSAEAPPAAPPAAATRVKRLKPTITRTTRRGLLRRGLRFTQRFPSAGIVRWTLKLRATRSKAATVIARARRTITRGGTIRMTIVLSRRGQRHVSRSPASSVVLHTSYLPTSATRRSDTTVVQLRR